MSQRKVAGRWVDEGPASVAATGVMAMHENGGMPHLAVPHGGAGAVEVSRVEVDEITRAEARTARLGPGLTNAERMQASRQRGAERHVEVVAAQHALAYRPSLPPPPEEEIVSEPRTDHSDPIPEPVDTPGADVLLDQVAVAGGHARLAWEEKAAADTAWDVAREALARAYAEVEWIVEPLPAPPDDGHVHQVMTIELHDALAAAVERIEDPEPETPGEAAIDEVEAAVITPGPAIGGGPAPRRNVREARTSGLTTRQAKAIELMQGGKTRADIARELGTTYQTIDGLFEAAAKKKLLPAELIPLLPARFAKYSGV